VSGKRILIVDPDAASRTFVARTLQAQQHEVLQADSGKEGLITAWRDRPDLIIMEPTVPDLGGAEFAQKIRQDPRTAEVMLIALSSDPSIARIKSCMEAGFNEYITKSGQAIPALTEALGGLLAIKDAAARVGGLLIVFLTAKGGTGTSSLCANIAMNIATNEPEARVVVVDMVLPIGSISPIVGYDGHQDVVSVAELGPAQTTAEYFQEQLPAMALWRFHLLAGSPDPESSNHLRIGRIWDIIAALKAGYDYVVVDVGRSLSRISLPLIQHADLITLVLGTDLSAVTLTKTLWEYLRSKGVGPERIYGILNRAVGLEGVTKAEAEKIIGLPIKTAMPYLGSNFALANNQHQPLALKFPNDTAAIVLRETASEMAGLARRLRGGSGK